LELAHSVRVVLVELVERLTQLRKEDRELTDAVKKLMKPGGAASPATAT